MKSLNPKLQLKIQKIHKLIKNTSQLDDPTSVEIRTQIEQKEEEIFQLLYYRQKYLSNNKLTLTGKITKKLVQLIHQIQQLQL